MVDCSLLLDKVLDINKCESNNQICQLKPPFCRKPPCQIIPGITFATFLKMQRNMFQDSEKKNLPFCVRRTLPRQLKTNLLYKTTRKDHQKCYNLKTPGAAPFRLCGNKLLKPALPLYTRPQRFRYEGGKPRPPPPKSCVNLLEHASSLSSYTSLEKCLKMPHPSEDYVLYQRGQRNFLVVIGTKALKNILQMRDIETVFSQTENSWHLWEEAKKWERFTLSPPLLIRLGWYARLGETANVRKKTVSLKTPTADVTVNIVSLLPLVAKIRKNYNALS